MLKITFTTLIITIFLFTQLSAQVQTTTSCITSGGGNGNIVVFANYDGGVLNINVDQNIPNLKIGVVTYEPVTINLSGAYVGNVTEVRYAGYVSTSNHHCSNSPSTTTITGVPSNITSINFLPPSTLSNPNGYSSIVCAYSCSTTSNQGGCNTADQVIDYFETTMNGSLYSYYTQYGCWNTTAYNVSAGGNCSFVVTDTVITSFITSDTSVCAGSLVDFTDQSPGSTAWSWNLQGAATGSSTSQNPGNISWNVAGTYTVTLTSTSNTGTCSAQQVIVVHPLPTAQITATDTLICPGDSVTLHGSGSAGVYLWQPGTISALTIQVAPLTSATYYLYVTDTNNCAGIDSIQIGVYPAPAIPAISYTSGLLTASPPAASYQWLLDGVPVPGATTNTYNPLQNGVYTVILTDSNGCSSEQSQPYTIYGVGVNEPGNADYGWQIYPNPVSAAAMLTIQLPETGHATLHLWDVAGRKLKTLVITSSAGYLDLSGISEGTYVAELITGSQHYYRLLIIN